MLCFEVYVLIAENRTKRKTAQCSVRWQRHRHRQTDATKAATLQSTANLSCPRFFLGKATHVSYQVCGTVRRMCSYAFCLFLQNYVAVGKRRKVKTTKKEPTAQTSGVHNDQHRAVCTPHSSSEDSPACIQQYISASSVGCG